ncbi:MAG: WD40 repeat domain-containing protein [Planctomycetes bacterium]|nr:WD40 repeat domain-containing protein [Planctomycetota bacterium]
MLGLLLSLSALQDVASWQPGASTREWTEAFVNAWHDLDSGRFVEAHREFDAALALNPGHGITALHAACAAAAHGDRAAALGHLEDAVEFGYSDADVVAWAPYLNELRDDPRFIDCVDRIRAGCGDRQEPAPAEPRLSAPGAEGLRFPAAMEPTTLRIGTVDASPSQDRLALPFSDGRIFLLELSTGRTLRVLSSGTSRVEEVQFDPTGALLLATSDDAVTRVFDVAQGTTVIELETELPRWPSCPAFFDAVGSRLLLCFKSRAPAMFDLESGREVWNLDEEPGCLHAVWSPFDARVYAWVGSRSEGWRLRSFDAATGEFVAEVPEAGTRIGRVQFHPDGRTLLIGVEGPALITRDIESGLVLEEFSHTGQWGVEPEDDLHSCILGRDGRVLSVARSSFMRSWDFATAEMQWEFWFCQASPGALHAQLSQNGSRLLFWGQTPRNTLVADWRTGRLVLNLAGRRFGQVGESLGGRQLYAIRGQDASLHVLDADSSEPLYSWRRDAAGEAEIVPARRVYCEDLDQVRHFGLLQDETWPDLAILAGQLLDPIRVRAARADVRVAPPRPVSLRLDGITCHQWPGRTTSHLCDGTARR